MTADSLQEESERRADYHIVIHAGSNVAGVAKPEAPGHAPG